MTSLAERMPTPVASAYRLARDLEAGERTRRAWALAFCGYEILRTVALPLLATYLRDGTDDARAREALRRAVGQVRRPYITSWIALLRTFARQFPKTSACDVFPKLPTALAALRGTRVRWFANDGAMRDQEPLDALVALRNQIAHGGLFVASDSWLEDARRVVDVVIAGFDLVADHRLAATGVDVVLIRPTGDPMSLGPLAIASGADLLLYDGHGVSGARRFATFTNIERRECRFDVASARTHAAFASRGIAAHLPAADAAPWSIVAPMLEHLASLNAHDATPSVVDDILASLSGDNAVTLVVGPPRSGKTRSLLVAARRLVEVRSEGSEDAVLFLRGQDIVQAGSVQRAVLELSGLESVAFASVISFLLHLEARRPEDRFPDRRLIVMVDGLEDCQRVVEVIHEVRALASDLSRMPWCRLVVSARTQLMDVLASKLGLGEATFLNDGWRRIPLLAPSESDDGEHVAVAIAQRPWILPAITTVLAATDAHGLCPGAEARSIRRGWASTRTELETRVSLDPIEMLRLESWLIPALDGGLRVPSAATLEALRSVAAS